MDQLFVYIIKEEILRNTLKTHSVILVTGWDGVGKTVTALKVGGELGDVFYYCASGGAVKDTVASFSESAVVVDHIGDLRSPGSEQPVLIIDDAHELSESTLPVVRALLENRPENVKIILITRVVVGIKSLLSNVDAVVRVTGESAEVMHSRLRDLHSL